MYFSWPRILWLSYHQYSFEVTLLYSYILLNYAFISSLLTLQVITLNVVIRDRQIIFEPQFPEVRDIVMKCFTEIVGSAENIPRVLDLFCISIQSYQRNTINRKSISKIVNACCSL